MSVNKIFYMIESYKRIYAIHFSKVGRPRSPRDCSGYNSRVKNIMETKIIKIIRKINLLPQSEIDYRALSKKYKISENDLNTAWRNYHNESVILNKYKS